MCEHGCERRDTNEMLAARFPHLQRDWLEQIERQLAFLERENGGNAEMHCRFSGGQLSWIDWIVRYFRGGSGERTSRDRQRSVRKQ